jgi:peptidoglycan/LPS O-acetylase OafA/YrhL
MIAMALFALYFIEKPAQRKLREWLHATSVTKASES